LFRSWWSVGAAGAADGCSGAVVAAGGVEGEVAEEFAGGGVDDAHVEVVDDHDDGGSVKVAADADVVQDAADAQGDVAVADAVTSDAGVGLVAGGGGGFGSGVVGGGGGAVAQGAVWSLLVVLVDELVEPGVELLEGRPGWVGGESQRLRVWWKRSTLPQVVWWLGREFF
jgi:hypothetical protein